MLSTQPPAPALGRRSMLLRGGALAAGVIGSGTALTALTAAPAAAAASGPFTAIAPFRCYDTRSDKFGKLKSGQAIDLQAFTDMGNVQRFPSSASAVTFNLTVTETESRGYLAVYPGNTKTMASLSTLNWVQSGTDLANGGVIALGTSQFSGVGSLLVYLSGFSNAASHVIVDITGWYSVGS